MPFATAATYGSPVSDAGSSVLDVVRLAEIHGLDYLLRRAIDRAMLQCLQ
jgi:hypothetical protein